MKVPFDQDRIIAKKVENLANEHELDVSQKKQLFKLQSERINELCAKREKGRESEQKFATRKDKIAKNALSAAKRELEEKNKRHQQDFEKLLNPHQLEKLKARHTNHKPERPKPSQKQK